MNSKTIASAWRDAASGGLDRLDAQILLLHALGRDSQDRAWLLAHDADTLPGPAAQAFEALCRRRAEGEPVAYLTGRREFFGLRLQVDARVLDPRSDTETLVEWALALPGLPDAARVIDLGTGSGAIALALKSQRPRWAVSALDASADALAVARANAQRLALAVDFAAGHWLRGRPGPYDLIVSNPPYVASADPHLAALRHEPLQALASGPDGLDDLRAIVAQAPACLAPGGWLLLEHGHDQAGAVRDLLARQGFTAVASRKDLAGIERCSGAQWPEKG
ncbi:MAG: peptide chain release factor N(5)-glutamine methyltransferase [Ramlibacter sp.]|nr:peptide chain release factor N(5)-glutamine methyltransferase [Ramlibacter sp.]